MSEVDVLPVILDVLRVDDVDRALARERRRWNPRAGDFDLLGRHGSLLRVHERRRQADDDPGVERVDNCQR